MTFAFDNSPHSPVLLTQLNRTNETNNSMDFINVKHAPSQAYTLSGKLKHLSRQ